MKNLSIRTKILAGVVLVNLLGALVVVVYLHQSFSTGLDVTAQKAVAVSAGACLDITAHAGQPLDVTSAVTSGGAVLERMKKITGGDYGLMIDKTAIGEADYAKIRAAAKLANNYSEGETYVMAAVTDEALAAKMRFNADPGSVPEMGKIVGTENGACTRTCHGSLKGPGNYWGVDWSNDGKSRAHSVYPIADSTGKAIGVVYSIDDLTPQVTAAEGSLFRTLFVILGTLLVATLLIGWMLDALVLRRLQTMTHAVQDLSVRVAGGDFDAKFEPDGTTDEIGAFEQFFSNFVDVMTSTIKSLKK